MLNALIHKGINWKTKMLNGRAFRSQKEIVPRVQQKGRVNIDFHLFHLLTSANYCSLNYCQTDQNASFGLTENSKVFSVAQLKKPVGSNRYVLK